MTQLTTDQIRAKLNFCLRQSGHPPFPKEAPLTPWLIARGVTKEIAQPIYEELLKDLAAQ